MTFKVKYWIFPLLIGTLFSCQDYLNEKPINAFVIPTTMEDLEALLNASWNVESSSSANELLADNYYVTVEDWQYLVSQSANSETVIGETQSYIWGENATSSSWSNVYKNPVYYSNVILEAANKISTEDNYRLDKIKGSALFYRSFALFGLSQVYCKAYGPTSNKDLGLVLRMTSDIEVSIKRSTVGETYEQIISDFELASRLLPQSSDFPTLPTKASAYGALARVYLSMRNYSKAGYYANLCLGLNNSLLDYNILDPKGVPIFGEYNEEIIFYSKPNPASILTGSRAKIDSNLFRSYESNDLRKSLFFLENNGTDAGTYRFRGSYLGRHGVNYNVFDGITTAEMYLIRAECFAREGNLEEAQLYLNRLLTKRMVTGSWSPIDINNQDELLKKILLERRKELVMRGLRWTDLRRFNEEGANITLIRVLGGITYSLPPGDLRWTILLSDEVIERSNIQQNPR